MVRIRVRVGLGLGLGLGRVRVRVRGEHRDNKEAGTIEMSFHGRFTSVLAPASLNEDSHAVCGSCTQTWDEIGFQREREERQRGREEERRERSRRLTHARVRVHVERWLRGSMGISQPLTSRMQVMIRAHVKAWCDDNNRVKRPLGMSEGCHFRADEHTG